MRFKKSSELPGAGRTRAWHHHGSHTPTSPGAILLGKMAYSPKQIRRQCRLSNCVPSGAIYLACKEFSQILVQPARRFQNYHLMLKQQAARTTSLTVHPVHITYRKVMKSNVSQL